MIQRSCSGRRGGLTGVLVASALVAGNAGCGLFDTSNPVDINVFAAHHARRDMDGLLPSYGFNNSPRTWVNDLGWQINVTEGYIVITGASIVSCDGEAFDLDLPFGPVPEYLNATDLDVIVVGSAEIPEGDYCELDVQYGPYRAEEAAMASEGAHPVPTGRDLEGQTIFIAGRASKDDVVVDFALISGESSEMRLKLREGDGTPTTYEAIAGGGAPKATVGKTYDRFFDGIDFSTYEAEAEAINAGLMEILVDETRAYRGTTIY